MLDIQCRDLRGALRVQKPLEDVKEKWAIKCCSQNLCDQKVNFCGDCRVPSSSGPTLSSSFFSTFSPRSSSAVSFWSLINVFFLRYQFVMLIACCRGFAKSTLPWKLCRTLLVLGLDPIGLWVQEGLGRHKALEHDGEGVVGGSPGCRRGGRGMEGGRV